MNVNDEHLEKFGVKPNIIGIRFHKGVEFLELEILKSIKNNTPYNEYLMLSKEQKKEYNEGNLLF